MRWTDGIGIRWMAKCAVTAAVFALPFGPHLVGWHFPPRGAVDADEEEIAEEGWNLVRIWPFTSSVMLSDMGYCLDPIVEVVSCGGGGDGSPPFGERRNKYIYQSCPDCSENNLCDAVEHAVIVRI